MTGKLSPLMLEVLRQIAAGEPRPKGRTGTLTALWSRGLIEDVRVREGWGWRLTKEGKLALRRGRQMISRRQR